MIHCHACARVGKQAHGAEQPASQAAHYPAPAGGGAHYSAGQYPGRSVHPHVSVRCACVRLQPDVIATAAACSRAVNVQNGTEMAGYPAESRGRMHGVPPGIYGGSHQDYKTIREPLFAPHGGMHPGMAPRVPRPVHTGHLGNFGPSQYLDQAMMEEYSQKMQMLQHDFDVMLRPKLDALRRQVVTVEERIREVSLMKDQLLEEAVLDHHAFMEQIHLSADRRLGALTLDLEQLMRDVALIHDLIQQLAPVQQGPQTPTAVWALLSRYDELSNACHQLASKRFKTTVEESAGDFRQEIGSMRGSNPQNAVLPKGSRHVRIRDASPSGGEGVSGTRGGATGAGGEGALGTRDASGSSQVDEMRALLQVKDQMVWMMLEERKKLSQEKSELQQANDALKLQLQAKDLDIESLEAKAVEEAERWNQVCEEYKAKLAQAGQQSVESPSQIASLAAVPSPKSRPPVVREVSSSSPVASSAVVREAARGEVGGFGQGSAPAAKGGRASSGNAPSSGASGTEPGGAPNP